MSFTPKCGPSGGYLGAGGPNGPPGWSERTTGVVQKDHGRGLGVVRADGVQNPQKTAFFKVFVLPQNVSKRVPTPFPDPVDPKYTTYGPAFPNLDVSEWVVGEGALQMSAAGRCGPPSVGLRDHGPQP